MAVEKSTDTSSAPVLQTDVNLAKLNSMGVPVKAAKFADITNKKQLVLLHESGFFDKYDPVILGGGSNMLFLDDPGQPVVKVSITGRQFVKQQSNTVLLKAGAGEEWHKVVTAAVENNYGGIENLALIPGTTGAAPIQNIGAYGVELKDSFHELTAFDTRSGEFYVFTADECRFGYRDSIFKRELKGKVIVCDVTLRLSESNHELNIGYKSLEGYLKEKGIHTPGIKDVYNAVVAIRQSKLPNPADIGNAGSFFKNPVVKSDKFHNLQLSYDLPFYKLGSDQYKIPAAWLIEQAGWKGKRVGNVGTYKNQALVLVNHGGATGLEIYEHAMKIKESVLTKFGIDLHPEVNIVGSVS